MLCKLAILMLQFYKATLSKCKGGKRCIFTPTCSVYAIEAYTQYRFVRASMLTLSRVLRCAPWGKGGVDYVPHNKHRDIRYYL